MGGVFRMNVKVRSSKTVISTGTMVPTWLSVAALYCLQKSMMATPWGPSAVPTGGAGVALPAGIWIFTTAATFFLAMFLGSPRVGRLTMMPGAGAGHNLLAPVELGLRAWRPG